MNIHLPIFVFQTVSLDGWLDKLIVPFVLLVATNAVTYYFSRKKNTADVGKTNAETIESLLRSIAEINDLYQQLHTIVGNMRSESQKKDDEAQVFEDMLEETEKKLKECLDNCTCKECADVLQTTLTTLSQINIFLEEVKAPDSVLLELKNLSIKISNLKLKR